MKFNVSWADGLLGMVPPRLMLRTESKIEPLSLDLPANLSVDIPGVVVNGMLEGAFILENESVGFGIEHLDDYDNSTIHVESSHSVLLQVHHYNNTRQCRAFCYDGREGRPCVDCERKGRTARICC